MPKPPLHVSLVATAAQALKDRKDEVNKLNVFPVPDGDTGTNMSLTMDAVIAALSELPPDADLAAISHAITQGSLMGARGNSGVILSQILRGLCDVAATATTFDQEVVAAALARAQTVAFQAVRKPVEGTMLTVLKDAAAEAKTALRRGDELDEMLQQVVHAAFESVRRTPELLPVLKENNVVDAGGYGVAILAEGLLAAYRGAEVHVEDVALTSAVSVTSVEPVDDWDDDEYLYCTEFLLHGDDLDRAVIEEYVAGQGGSELVVGEGDLLKIHVHTNDPGSVLSHMTTLGEVAEVHVNNMRKQTAARSAGLRSEAVTPTKPYGIVTVAAGAGMQDILRSLGADVIVNGGQTMNPSTAELLEAASGLPVERVLLLPNNRNIQMAAQQAAQVSEVPMGVVPTTSVPEAFAALLAFDAEADLDSNVAAMTEVLADIRTGEVTTAIKDSKGKAGSIKAGQVIGITEHEIEVIGEDVLDVAARLVTFMLGDAEAVTVLAGEDLSDEDLAVLVDRIESEHEGIEVEAHRGDQPLYPVVLSVE